MLKIGRIGYINTVPLFSYLNETRYELISAPPTKLNEMLLQGKIDISLVSTAVFLENEEHYTRITNLCIASYEEIQSVCLYYKGTLQELTYKTIALTSESASAAQLLKVLCRHFWKITPLFTPLQGMMEQQDAFLLIGDFCLRNKSIPGFQKLDLGSAWYHATGLPFTFAVFAAHKNSFQNKREEIEHFTKAITDSYEAGKKDSEHLLEMGLKSGVLEKKMLRSYFNCLHFEFDAEEARGVQRFHELCKRET